MGSVSGDGPRLSIVVTSYTMGNLGFVETLHRSLCRELLEDDEVVYVIERCEALSAAIRKFDIPRACTFSIVDSEEHLGLSEARNLGVREADGEWIGFVDDDAILTPGWRSALDQGIGMGEDHIGFTGPSRARYAEGARRLCPEVNWVNSCWDPSHARPHVVRNAIGVNMVFSRDAFEEVETWFDPFYGAVQGTGGGGLVGEEVDFAIRVRSRTGRTILFLPGMAVEHQIPVERTRWRFISHRSKAEGRTKAVLRRVLKAHPIGGAGMGRERGHLVRILLVGIPRTTISILWRPRAAILDLRDLLGSTWLVGSRFIIGVFSRG